MLLLNLILLIDVTFSTPTPVCDTYRAAAYDTVKKRCAGPFVHSNLQYAFPRWSANVTK
jgi:hypothetical protein